MQWRRANPNCIKAVLNFGKEVGVMFPEYPTIDAKRTGKYLRQLVDQSGYSVKQIQEYLHLACPQPIYRWFKGQIMPSLDHIYALSLLFHVHIDDILVPRLDPQIEWMLERTDNLQIKRYLLYYQKLSGAA